MAQLPLYSCANAKSPQEELGAHVQTVQLLVGDVQVQRDQRVCFSLLEHVAEQRPAPAGARPHHVHEASWEYRVIAQDFPHDEFRCVDVRRVAHAAYKQPACPLLEREARDTGIRVRVYVGQEPDLVLARLLGCEVDLATADHEDVLRHPHEGDLHLLALRQKLLDFLFRRFVHVYERVGQEDGGLVPSRPRQLHRPPLSHEVQVNRIVDQRDRGANLPQMIDLRCEHRPARQNGHLPWAGSHPATSLDAHSLRQLLHGAWG
mmetsp:Transcript_119555/g.320910  ORF Transcript_119555/g.320910 Transcript_119555/m.320910 type:complete len:262 (-) Transcript_119555:115-900(-)